MKDHIQELIEEYQQKLTYIAYDITRYEKCVAKHKQEAIEIEETLKRLKEIQ